MEKDMDVRQKLKLAAKAEFLKSGYQKASLRHISKTAGVSTGSVYFFFGSKEELFHAVVDEAADALRTLLIKGAEKEYAGEATGEENDRAFIETLHRYPEEAVILLEKAQDSPMAAFRDEIVALLEKGFMAFFLRAGGETKDDKLIRLLVEQRVSAMLSLISRRYGLQTTVRYTVLLGAYGESGFSGMMEKYHQMKKDSAE